MDPAIISALIGGAASLANGAVSAGSAALQNRRSYKWSKKFFDYQNEYNLLNYSPAANMERYRQAGINPHEVSGSAGSGTSLQGNMNVPDYQNPIDPLAKSLPAAIQQAMNIYQQKKSVDNQTDLVESQIAKNKADAARTNYQVANILPYESVYAKNRQSIPLYQLESYGLQNRKLMQDISLMSLQGQKYQLAIDLMEIEKKYREDYLKWRNESVKNDSRYKGSQAGISGLDFWNYRETGLRPQDPYYMRIAGNVVDQVEKKGGKGLWQSLKDWWYNPEGLKKLVRPNK